ncbi:MAG: division/cell wall cluster transcriptional repressor MraZ [Candidatus Marinimicrobia bacterium]|nr:division/cell wall cluster transcriptional repressor MraZ [Candidatus Neomarinimicrobiota bacterium]MDD5583390.1 division/cell wall cluster transcriptional repressor MraZ [Candidatus Neomarinimicrobiota bacterium]
MNIDFIGQYPYTVDAKNRINIPSRFRKKLSEAGISTMIITRGIDDPCILVYPEPYWQEMTRKLSEKLSTIKQTHRLFLRQMTRFASECPLDSQGRIILTPALMEYARITRDVMIVGTLNKIELWDPEVLESFEKSHSLSEEDFTTLANDILL